ncbi:hypothetical protein CEXT_198291 [Caerostris extrusa]|uniref:Uncharacterized protein n=1 Tax=Caerostris extrusa TaxID=172846 RepID=A0AAV4M7V3_CAEEX|nr:hypothetical protein CEXT_198291 [Caerostris extrusa]
MIFPFHPIRQISPAGWGDSPQKSKSGENSEQKSRYSGREAKLGRRAQTIRANFTPPQPTLVSDSATEKTKKINTETQHKFEIISPPSNTTNIPGKHLRKVEKVVKTQNKNSSLPASEQKLGRRAVKQSGRLSRLRNPLCFPFRLSGSLPAARLSPLNQTPVFSLRSGGLLGGCSTAREKTEPPPLFLVTINAIQLLG